MPNPIIPRKDVMNNHHNQEDALKRGVLSSFTVSNLRQTFQYYRDQMPGLPCELYTFMQPTVDDMKRRSKILVSLNSSTVLRFLEECNKTPQTEIDIADIIDKEANGDPKVDIVSFASFFPDLSSNPDEEPARSTREAICFLAKLALELRSHRDHENLNTLELVAGSLIANPRIEDYSKQIRVSVINPDDAISNIIENLIRVLKTMEKDIYPSYPNQNTPLTFALEIEPGPLYAVNNFDSIDKLCKELDEKQKENGCLKNVGLNLDIAHWNIALHQNPRDDDHYSLENMKNKNKHIFRRICHAHISGYHRAAHFGDLPIKLGEAQPPVMNKWDCSSFDRGDSDSFSSWIMLLKERMKMKDGVMGPNFSGYIICELEATGKIEYVKNTIQTLQERGCI